MWCGDMVQFSSFLINQMRETVCQFKFRAFPLQATALFYCKQIEKRVIVVLLVATVTSVNSHLDVPRTLQGFRVFSGR